MEQETVKQIIDEIRSIDEYNIHTARDLNKAYTPDEIDEAMAEYARMRDLQFDILEDSFVGTCILSYEMRTGETIDKDGFIEEMVILHLISMALDIDMYEYEMENILIEMGIL